jgi:hypothetical protein
VTGQLKRSVKTRIFGCFLVALRPQGTLTSGQLAASGGDRRTLRKQSQQLEVTGMFVMCQQIFALFNIKMKEKCSA